MAFKDYVISFFAQLELPCNLPADVEPLLPYQKSEVQHAMRCFFTKYFSDARKRYMLVGINPGRFGAGITGINFTAPKQLSECGIAHPFGTQSELSAEFIYRMIGAYGGADKFYADFYIAAMSPVGFVRNGKNLNYYDDPQLMNAIRPYAKECINSQLKFGFHREIAICIGGDKNMKFFSALNKENNWFRELIAVPHPRFIMQYRRSKLDEHIEEYLSALRRCVKY